MKKKIAICLVLIVVFITFIGILEVDATSTYGNFLYEIENNEVIITGLSGETSNSYIIPDKINNLNVTKIKDRAFYQSSALNNVIVTLGNNITNIGNEAFSNSKIGGIIIRGNIEKIGDNCFENCTSLKKIDIQGTVQEIGEKAFNNCTDLSMPLKLSGVNIIGKFAFNNCSKLNRVEIPITVSEIRESAFEGTVWLKRKQEENEFVIINNILIDATAYKGSELIIPEGINEIASGAFKNVETLTKVVIPDRVNIDNKDNVFDGCINLKEVQLPSNMKDIGLGLFSNCTKLDTLEIPESVTRIREKAFNGTQWLLDQRKINPLVIRNDILIDATTCGEIVNVPDNIKLIVACAFQSARNVRKVVLPDSVIEIGSYAFFDCEKLEEVQLPSNLKIIENNAFFSCPMLTELKIPNADYIGEYALMTLSDLKIVFKGDVKNLAENIVEKENSVLYVRRNTNILDYAIKNELNYVILGNLLGDVNADGRVDALDARLILRKTASRQPFTDTQEIDGDVNFDGKVNTLDARRILMYSAKIITSFYK